MSESVIADFVGSFNSEVTTRDEPVQGRVVLSQRRLVLAASESEKITIPLTSIFDISVGHVPDNLGDFFKSTVTVAFDRGEKRLVAGIEADDDTIDKFATVLFKAVLNGTEVSITERARVGGRVTDDGFHSAALVLQPGAVAFRQGGDDTFEVDLGTVIEFKRTTTDINGQKRPVIRFRHMIDGTAVTTLVALSSPRKMSILGRYLRLEYGDVMQELKDLDLGQDEVEVLVAIYSAGDMAGVPLASILDREAAAVSMLLEDLTEDGLVQDAADGPSLTPKGEIVASRHLEDVNG